MRRDPILMCPYDPAWPISFEQHAAVLNEALEPWLVGSVEHIGSTAVPGLVAKPIVDVLAVVTDIGCAPAATRRLEDAGWCSAPEPTDAGLRELSFCTPSVEHRTHHLHVVEASSSGWRGWLAFRDVLRRQPELVAEYGELKQRLARDLGADPNQRDAYRAGKAAWIAAVTNAALATDSGAREAGALADADDLNAAEFAHLTTTGRDTRQPHTVELWFWCERDRIWFLAGIDPPIVDGRPDWLRNLAEDPDVTVRIGDHVFHGRAAIMDDADGSAEARRQIARRYMGWQADEPLPKWQRHGVAVVVMRR